MVKLWEVGISILFIGAIWLFLKLAENLAEEHQGLRLLFLILACLLVILGSSLAINIATSNSASNDVLNNLSTFYKVVLYSTIFVIGYFIIYFVYKTLWVVIPLTKGGK